MPIYDDGRPRMVLETGNVLGNDEVAPGVWVMEVTAPMCSETAQPGQFLQLKLPGDSGTLLRLPFSIYGTVPENGTVEILYQVVGAGTRYMTGFSLGSNVGVLGPIGHGWQVPDGPLRALIVTGGVGAAAMGMLAKSLRARHARLDFCMGASTSKKLVGRDRFSRCGTVSVATDDGSEGLHGTCADLAERLLDAFIYDIVFTCGPEPMQRTIAQQCMRRGIPCEVNLERLMACGIGACLSCVVDTVGGKRRVCVDGPVFGGEEVIW